MKFILFCKLPYAVGIMQSIADELTAQGHDYYWYLHGNLNHSATLDPSKVLTTIEQVYNYEPDVIFVPGNDVPWYLSGLKVQIFHGLAGEKKGHFRIRDYFDLYLTQGPYFTERFMALAENYKNFKVIQTGWSKLDFLFQRNKEKNAANISKEDYTILYAPTFSPSLTSASVISQQISDLSEEHNVKVVIKFHDKMSQELKEIYTKLKSKSLIISSNPDIRDTMINADLMISDTSSVVYEFLLLNKPVLTLNSTSENILWEDTQNVDDLKKSALNYTNGTDPFADKRREIVNLYHPYSDGQSAKRVVNAAISEVNNHGRPESRKLPFHRKLKLYKIYKYIPKWTYWFK